MSKNINFGIDLGTTNSAIAKFVKGEIEVFSNPLDLGRYTLPSVVHFKKNRIIVGPKAKERFIKGSKDVFSVFKRKMGTSETYKVESLKQSKTPVELSSLVLKELKTFVGDREKVEAAVITIPASFDTIQSNATKEAGELAGIKQVQLLQEPIAASLAYANKSKDVSLEDGKWLVYDFGGGTFDVALVSIQNDEMRVLDHEGNNFLGGSDFDRLIIEKLVVPFLEERGEFENLLQEMQRSNGKYNKEYNRLLVYAEQAKIELSARTSAEMELVLEDEEGEELDEVLTITRSEFEALIKELVDGTIDMVEEIITRNGLQPRDLQFILLVGGSTYIPFVRNRVAERTGVKVNTDIDPTTAIAIGAAYYAGGKELKIDVPKGQEEEAPQIKVKMAYQKSSKETEEFFAARISGPTEGYSYRIDRGDGGFTTGMKPLKAKIAEDLPLLPDSYNFFKFIVFDSKNNVVPTDAEEIGINSGYAVSGQPLPEDICLEVDDPDSPGKTKLWLVLAKNRVLPASRTFTKTLNKTLRAGSDDSFRVSIIEGSHLGIPESGKNIGFMEITGERLHRDLLGNSDLEITIKMSENRDLEVTVYVQMLDMEFQETFSGKKRHTPPELLQEQTRELEQELQTEIEQAVAAEDYETAEELRKLQNTSNTLSEEVDSLADDDSTDKRYQLEDKKRKLAQAIGTATRDKHLKGALAEYKEVKERCWDILSEHGNDDERRAYEVLISQEEAFLNGSSPLKVKEKTEELRTLMGQVLWRAPQFLGHLFKDLITNHAHRMNNQQQVQSLANAGKYAIQQQEWPRLAEVNQQLIGLLPKEAASSIVHKIGFN